MTVADLLTAALLGVFVGAVLGVCATVDWCRNARHRARVTTTVDRQRPTIHHPPRWQ